MHFVFKIAQQLSCEWLCELQMGATNACISCFVALCLNIMRLDVNRAQTLQKEGLLHTGGVQQLVCDPTHKNIVACSTVVSNIQGAAKRCQMFQTAPKHSRNDLQQG